MNKKELRERIEYFTKHLNGEGPPLSTGDLARLQIFSTLLLAETMFDLQSLLDRLLKKEDVDPLNDDDHTQKKLQFEAHGADSIDPTALHEDLNATLSEDSPVNQNLKVVQGRSEHVSDLAARR